MMRDVIPCPILLKGGDIYSSFTKFFTLYVGKGQRGPRPPGIPFFFSSTRFFPTNCFGDLFSRMKSELLSSYLLTVTLD